MAMVEAAAATDSVVLFTGESGTGKELLARRLHALSGRASGPFVKVNCAAVPLEMWESEFFGHRKGSFAGAATDREGRFQLADRGTLLLDEVAAMPTAGQAKLLRAIQDGEFERLGDDQATRVDVRVVASTNSDLEAEVQQGRFRADLFYRLNVVRIDVPPLRERREDIPLLARPLRRARSRSASAARRPSSSPATLARLAAYPWPGNVREVRNVIERAMILDPARGLEDLDLAPGGVAGVRSRGAAPRRPRAQPARRPQQAGAGAAARGAPPGGRGAQGRGAPPRDRPPQPELLHAQARARRGRGRGVRRTSS